MYADDHQLYDKGGNLVDVQTYLTVCAELP